MYRVVVYPEAADQLAELPASALADYARVMDAVEVAPWNGPPHNERNPEGAVRRWSFGPGDAGQVLYLVLEHQRDYSHGDISRTEAMANLLHVAGLFGSTDDDPYEQYLPALARSVARCWEGLLAVQFPDRRFTIEVYGDSPSELDPNITFYTSTP